MATGFLTVIMLTTGCGGNDSELAAPTTEVASVPDAPSQPASQSEIMPASLKELVTVADTAIVGRLIEVRRGVVRDTDPVTEENRDATATVYDAYDFAVDDLIMGSADVTHTLHVPVQFIGPSGEVLSTLDQPARASIPFDAIGERYLILTTARQRPEVTLVELATSYGLAHVSGDTVDEVAADPGAPDAEHPMSSLAGITIEAAAEAIRNANGDAGFTPPASTEPTDSTAGPTTTSR